MQSILLIMCLFWQRRQRKLQIDDFGNPLPVGSDAESPIPVRRGRELDREGLSVTEAVDTAIESDVRVQYGIEHEIHVPREETPLLIGGKKTERKAGLWGRLFGGSRH